MIITPDLKQNIFYTLYFTVTHNFLAILYSLGILFAVLLSVLRPSRKSVFLLLGFIILLFGYEYNKHIVEGLREQTINALITIQEHNKVRRLINIITLKLLPLFLPVAGWALVFAAGFIHFQDRKTRNQKKTSHQNE